MALGRVKEAIAVREYVAEREPVNVTGLYNLGLHYLAAGRYDDAIARLRTALSLSPGREGAHYLIGLALLLKGEPAAALAEIQQEPNEVWRAIGLPMVYHALGREADSDAALAELIRKDAKDSAYNIAYVYAYRGEADRAFEWLEKAVEYDDPGLALIVLEPLFGNLRSDARWLPFLRRIGKAPEQLGKIEFRVRLPEPAGAGAPAAAAGTRPAALADGA
ncbi:MAG: tetratricopeptide repeat protein [Gemmatimonadetes bacterium]|nr:tetratricopeptide repeat protein [Gemmatimonadota bacterium]